MGLELATSRPVRKRGPALFRYFPNLQRTLPWVALCPDETTVHRLPTLSHRLGADCWIKREDQTDSLYGGNKVRNLEFLLGSALEKQAEEILTLAPLGSNYIAALSAQASKFSLRVSADQFVLADNPQIEAHWKFSRHLGASAYVHQGRTGIARAALRSFTHRLGSKLFFDELYWCPPGATNWRGALGHVNAALELAEQIKAEKIPTPDFIFVGAGTCGTLAGLLAAKKILGLRSEVIGVRCLSAFMCHRVKVARLANALLDWLGSPHRIESKEVTLVDSPVGIEYSKTSDLSLVTAQTFFDEEGITLDQTYTAKVVAYLQQWAKDRVMGKRNLLYWHTFSPAAMEWRRGQA